jgi:hypothetical protein
VGNLTNEMKDINLTFENAETAYQNLLPKQFDDWRKIYPLDAIVIAPNDESFEKFKSNWESFLESLDKIWNRLNAFARHHVDNEKTKNSILGYLGQINNTRKNDDLLLFLDKARNSAHHTLWRHIRQAEQNEIISDAKGVNIDISNGQINITSPSGGTVSEIVVLNNYTILLSAVDVIENRQKKTYYLPEKHLTTNLYPIDRALPHMIGKMGLMYYENVINEISKRIN